MIDAGKAVSDTFPALITHIAETGHQLPKAQSTAARA